MVHDPTLLKGTASWVEKIVLLYRIVISAVGKPRGGKGLVRTVHMWQNGAGCRDGGEGVNVGWAIIGVSANPWVHHLQI
jgi:hypothetical protein